MQVRLLLWPRETAMRGKTEGQATTLGLTPEVSVP